MFCSAAVIMSHSVKHGAVALCGTPHRHLCLSWVVFSPTAQSWSHWEDIFLSCFCLLCAWKWLLRQTLRWTHIDDALVFSNPNTVQKSHCDALMWCRGIKKKITFLVGNYCLCWSLILFNQNDCANEFSEECNASALTASNIYYYTVIAVAITMTLPHSSTLVYHENATIYDVICGRFLAEKSTACHGGRSERWNSTANRLRVSCSPVEDGVLLNKMSFDWKTLMQWNPERLNRGTWYDVSDISCCFKLPGKLSWVRSFSRGHLLHNCLD